MVTRMRNVLIACVAAVAFLAGCFGMAVLVMWVLLWPFEVLARVLGVS